MRFFGGVFASVIVSFALGFFPSVAEAQQNPCDPDGEYYDARTCFDYVRALEAKNASAKRDLALARSDASILTSRLKAVEARHTHTSNDLRLDIISGVMTIRSLETTEKLLSEEKEIAWGYVDMIMKTVAAVIIFVGIVVLYLLRKRTSDYDRYSLEVRDKKIRELEEILHIEINAKIVARDDAATLRRELFQKSPNLWEIRNQINDLLSRVRSEMPKFDEVSAVLERALLLLRANRSRLEKLSDPASAHVPV